MIQKIFTIGCTVAVSLVAGCAMAQNSENSAKAMQQIIPQPIPSGFNFPTPGAVIEQWASNGNIPKIRAHGWDVSAAMSQPTDQIYRSKRLPVWNTWQSDSELFNTKTTVPSRKGEDRILHPFHKAHQHTHLRPNEEPVGDVPISFNKFDPTAAKFILIKQAAPDGSGKNYAINAPKGLAAINAAWPKDTAAGTRTIRDFPETAIETKPVFLPVLAGKLTAVPIWQGPNQATNKTNPTPDTWFTCVLVDATNSATSKLRAAKPGKIAGATIATNFNCKTYLYAPIGMYYSVKLDKAGAQGFTALQGTTTTTGVAVKAGDYAVLTAMHMNTKELDRWTWQTFYWQGDANHEVTFPGTLSDSPASLKAPWNSYAMCTAYDQIISGKRVVCFNPYLETSAGIPDGINSNCVSCHGMARIGGTMRHPAIRQPIPTTRSSQFQSNSTIHDCSTASPRLISHGRLPARAQGRRILRSKASSLLRKFRVKNARAIMR